MRVSFDYQTMSSDRPLARTVDPYGLFHAQGAWYLIGRDHLRDAERVFKIARIDGAVDVDAKHPKSPDFEVPPGFDPGSCGGREWDIGEPDVSARVRFSPRIAWMVERHVAGSGTWTARADGGAVWETGPANERRLVDWLLSFGENAELLAPPQARVRLADRLAAAAREQMRGPDATA
jgi:predicted DNA-binding transcriptional regulator YafY